MPAAPSKIVLRVDAATARVYRDASKEAKQRARSAFESALAERQQEERSAGVDELIRFMDQTAGTAEARELTPGIPDDILQERPPSPEELAGPRGTG